MSSGAVVAPSHQEDANAAETSEEESLTTDEEVMLGLLQFLRWHVKSAQAQKIWSNYLSSKVPWKTPLAVTTLLKVFPV